MGAYIGLIAKSGTSGLSSFGGNAQINANNSIITENASSANSLRLYKNAATAEDNNLARFTQSVNNQKIMDAGGKTLNANTTNFLRGNDNQQMNTFAGQIDAAQQMGRQAAVQAANGLSGSGVADMVNSATALRASIAKATSDQYMKSQQQDYSQEQANVMSRMTGSLNNSVVLDALDYNRSVALTTPTSHRTLIDKIFMPMGAITGQSVSNDFRALGGQDMTQVGKVVADGTTKAYASWQQKQGWNNISTSAPADGYNPNASPASTYSYTPTIAGAFEYDPYDDKTASAAFSFNYSGGGGGL